MLRATITEMKKRRSSRGIDRASFTVSERFGNDPELTVVPRLQAGAPGEHGRAAKEHRAVKSEYTERVRREPNLAAVWNGREPGSKAAAS